jgi:glutamyl-tRNA synthetase
MSHIPLIHGPDGAKLSKRHGALGVEEYRKMGYIPAAMREYLVRLGWSNGSNDMLTTQEMIAAFDVSGIGRSASRFDFAKLENLNGHYMRATPDDELLDILIKALPHLPEGPAVLARLDDAMRAKLLRAMAGLKERAKTLNELLDGARFMFDTRPLPFDAKALEILNPTARGHIAALLPRFGALPDWTAAASEGVVRAYVEETGAKLGQVAQPLRAALTGRGTSPGIFDVLEVLGREESLARLADQAQG